MASCKDKIESKSTDLKTQPDNISSFDGSKLGYYFAEYEIKPLIAVYNNDGNQVEVELEKHTVKWLNSEDETKIKIDNDLFTLRDKVTINMVWNNNDSVDFSNNWDEMKYYKINDRELLGIRMSYQPCTGLGCGVDYFLIYDLKTKTKNFFGTFRTDNRLALYNFNNDDKLDYLSKTFRGDLHASTPKEFIYELYSMEVNGHFVQQKNSSGQAYQIRQITFPNDTINSETFEQTWFTNIK